ncbi:peptide/nickel transport system substrate-binding protein [Poseidonocella pacifica]|uniref:Peptide/nickel transport system substrate-binding protein n=2 Tax=Poseidonocella pacifica TaxID=871651 RepID=A0A1I0VNJ4_9RHOB|nr:peptide/nickel transport system substrate-binding protein [Poseidonocella pacifica]
MLTKPLFFLRPLTLILAGLCTAPFAQAEPTHGIAMYGTPALPPDFVSLPYANPDAPKGGRIVTGESGSFDSLNPHILKGNVPWALRFLAYESLMGRSWDEPFTLYGLLAESIEVGPDREWAEFTLREGARFSDGTPVTVEDVMWSYETLGTVGHPRYRGTWDKIAAMEKTGPRGIRFTFNEANRELALIIGMRPILKKAQWEGLDFADSGLDVIPISTAPYVIDAYEAGRYVSLKRNPDYWGNDLPFRRGTNNFDEIRMEFYGDGAVAFEAFKAGEVSTFREFNAEKWETQYNFPAVERGDVVKSVIPHERPTGMTGFVMNTRRPQFEDWRVRSAMIHAFNFEFINQALTGGRQPRIASYFSNSVLGMKDGPATDEVRALLEPFAEELPPGAIDGYALPVSDGSARNRSNIAKALDLMEQAGWTVQNGRLADATGTPFTFDILLQSADTESQSIIDIYLKALERLGISASVTSVDSAQFESRLQDFDFDMTYYRRGVSLSPGNELFLYWGQDSATSTGSSNLMGVASPAVDAMIREILTSESNDGFVAATRALDRILTAGRYVIPIYQFNISRVAHAKELKFPDALPIYGDWIGWQPDVWWYED